MKLAIILPAYNEELCIDAVLRDFHSARPDAEIVVIDNNSSDRTAEIARRTLEELGANGRLLFMGLQGKAHAVRLAFEECDADVYVMADADLTYAAADLPNLLEPVLEGRADMVVGDRLSGGDYRKENKRAFHNFGNVLVRETINALFRARLRDIMSGYRVFSRKFVKNFPVLSRGFDLETEMTVHALTYHFRIEERGIVYKDRPEGSFSKLDTVKDGYRVLNKIASLFVTTRPWAVFGTVAALCIAGALALGLFPVLEFFQTGYVKRLPSLVAASAVSLVGVLTIFSGILLGAFRREQRFQFHHRVLHSGRSGAR